MQRDAIWVRVHFERRRRESGRGARRRWQVDVAGCRSLTGWQSAPAQWRPERIKLEADRDRAWRLMQTAQCYVQSLWTAELARRSSFWLGRLVCALGPVYASVFSVRRDVRIQVYLLTARYASGVCYRLGSVVDVIAGSKLARTSSPRACIIRNWTASRHSSFLTRLTSAYVPDRQSAERQPELSRRDPVTHRQTKVPDFTRFYGATSCPVAAELDCARRLHPPTRANSI